LLVTVTFPVTLPGAAGAKVTFKDAVCPGVRIVPVDTPLGLKPAPEKLTFEIVTFELPEFVCVPARVLLAPVFMFPKLKVVGLALSKNVTALTVSVAGVLWMLPTELLTTTVNCAPVSAAAVAGVVYRAEVPPLTTAPFLNHWKLSGAVPEAVTEKVAVCPAVTVWLTG